MAFCDGRSGLLRIRANWRWLRERAGDFLFGRPGKALSGPLGSSVATPSRSSHAAPAGIVSPFSYRDPAVRQGILELKSHGSAQIGAFFARALHPELLRSINESRRDEDGIESTAAVPILLIPIPSSRRRRKQRGFNQTEIVARELARIDADAGPAGAHALSLCLGLLIKARHTPPQTSLSSRAARLSNLSGCFAVTDPARVRDAVAILLDDVTTTGATLHEAKKTLLEAGARRVIPVAIAH